MNENSRTSSSPVSCGRHGLISAPVIRYGKLPELFLTHRYMVVQHFLCLCVLKKKPECMSMWGKLQVYETKILKFSKKLKKKLLLVQAQSPVPRKGRRPKLS